MSKEKKIRTYTLKTIEDITNVLTNENVDNFLVDFKAWLSYRLKFKEVKIDNLVKFDNTKFTWIDDGKHEADIRLKVKFIK